MNLTEDSIITVNGSVLTNTLPILQACYTTVAVLTIISNAVICLILGKRKHILRQSSNKFIFGLSVAGLIESLTLFIMPSFILPVKDFVLPTGLLGDIFCRLIVSEYLLHVPCYLSVQIIALMGIERWYAVVKATKYKRVFSKRNTSISLLILVCLSFVWPVDYILRDTYMSLKPDLFSPCQLIARQNDFVIFFTLETFRLYLPLLLTIFCYADISRRTGPTNSNKRPSFKKVRHPRAEWTTIRSQIKATIRRKLTYMAFISFIVFAICWLPRLIYQFLILFNLVSFTSYYLVKRAVLLPIVLNAFLNPIIYASTNDTIRKGLGFKNSIRFPSSKQHTHLSIISSAAVGIDNQRFSLISASRSLRRFPTSVRNKQINASEILDSDTSIVTPPRSNEEKTNITRIIVSSQKTSKDDFAFLKVET